MSNRFRDSVRFLDPKTGTPARNSKYPGQPVGAEMFMADQFLAHNNNSPPPVAANGWTVTLLQAGAAATTQGYALYPSGHQINCDIAIGDGANNQHLSHFNIADGQQVYFEACYKLSGASVAATDVTKGEVFVGLSSLDTTVLASAPADYIGFVKQDVATSAGNEVRFVAGRTVVGAFSTGLDVGTGIVLDATADGSTALGTWIRVAFLVTGTDSCEVFAGENTWTATDKTLPTMQHIATVGTNTTGYGTGVAVLPNDLTATSLHPTYCVRTVNTGFHFLSMPYLYAGMKLL